MANNGNCAAMREALEYVKERIGSWWEYLEVSEKVESAIAAPPRNCDVGTAEEQEELFREFCRRHEAAGECGIGSTQAKCPCWRGPKNPDCALAWAQMPYEEEK